MTSIPSAFLLLVLAADTTSPSPIRPPAARKQPHSVQIHGETLGDDYPWLRAKGTAEVETYLKAELAYAEAFMKPTGALQQKIYDEMLSRIQQTDTNVPYRERGFLYYSRTEEGKQYPIHCRKKGSLEAPEEVILDVNQLAAGKKFMSVGDLRPSPDGTLLAYSTDETGFRQYTLVVKDLATGRTGPESIPRVTSVAWTEDGRSLVYTVEHPQTKRSYQLYRHTLGGTRDELLFEEKDERFSMGVWKSRDRQYLFVDIGSHTTSEVRYLPAAGSSFEMKVVAPREPEHEYDVDHRAGTFWIRTNDKGRNFRLVTAEARDPSRPNWREVVPHREDVMLSALDLFKGFYVLVEREAGLPHLRITNIATGASHRVEFPEKAYQAFPSTNREFDARLYRFAYESPITSASIYDYDPATRERTLLKQVAVLGGYDKSRYRVEVTSARAPDGVQVPMWMVYRKDLKLDGSNPALLYAYGSYGATMSAGFSSNLFSLVDRGVVYAVAYIRGGGELGKKWHDEGRMLKKKNTFTDFIAAAEHLIASGYTRQDRLAIMGGSAGGLLMGAVTNMRPDLFKVVVSKVPFVDVITTMLDESIPLTVGEFEEWGNPKIPEQYRYMRSYSPYDNIAPKPYPTILVKTSYNDSQVMYWEPAKYVARLRATKTDANPLVFHINMDPAGHGGKSGRYERWRETAFDYAFLLWQLGVEKVAAEPAGSKQPLTHEALWLMKRVGSPAVSPDGKWAVFLVTEPSYDEKKEVVDLWIVPTNGSAGPRRLTSSKGGESAPAWSPDSRKVAFAAKREDDEVNQVYVIDVVGGGEARRVTSSPLAARAPVWSPDGGSILYQASAYPGAVDAEANKKIAAERKDPKSKVRIYDSFPIRRWDKWLDDTQTHLFVVSAHGEGKARDLLAGTKLAGLPGFGAPGEGSGEDLGAAWAPDGKSVVFVAATNRNTGVYAPVNTHLFEVPAEGGEPRALTTGNATHASPQFSPDGKSLCFRMGEEWGRIYALDRLACGSWPWSGSIATLTQAFDRSVSDFAIAPDGRIFLTAEDSGYVKIFSVPAKGGAVTPLLDSRGVYAGIEVPEGARPTLIVASWGSGVNPAEIVRIDPATGKQANLTQLNLEKVATLDWAPLQEFWFTGAKGRRIHSFIALPPGFDPSRKYPLLVLIHGGHANMWRDQITLRWNYHLLASPGYVVLLTDYRGSTGYGEQFTLDILGDPLRGPADDINHGADEAIKRHAFIDGTRQCAGGASYGGHLANWLEAATDRYKCLISHAGLSSLQTQWSTSDVMHGRELMMGGPWWEKREAWLDQSPVAHAKDFKTPMLLSVGENDFRVPMNNTLEMYTVLQRMRVPTRMLVWPDENHWIVKGENSRVFYREVHDWLARWLK